MSSLLARAVAGRSVASRKMIVPRAVNFFMGLWLMVLRRSRVEGWLAHIASLCVWESDYPPFLPC